MQVSDHGSREAWHPGHRLQEDDPRQDGPLVQGLQVALNGVSGSQVEAEPNVYVQTTELCKYLLGFLIFFLDLVLPV